MKRILSWPAKHPFLTVLGLLAISLGLAGGWWTTETILVLVGYWTSADVSANTDFVVSAAPTSIKGALGVFGSVFLAAIVRYTKERLSARAARLAAEHEERLAKQGEIDELLAMKRAGRLVISPVATDHP